MSETRRPSRRDLFRNAACLTAGGVMLSAARTDAATPTPAGEKPLPFKISLAQWSLHLALEAKKVDPLDFAKIANGLGFDAIEYVNQFYVGKAKERSYLAELKRRASGEGVWSALIMVDDEGKLGDADAAKRAQAVENHKKWIDAAAFLGCHSVRVNGYADGTPEEASKRVTESLRKLAEYADPFGVNVLVENHGELTSDAAWLTKTIRATGHPRCGTLPDFGNFENFDRYKGVEQMMPLARAVSAKSYDFDKSGNETKIDYSRMMRIVAAAGFHGYVGVEYEGTVMPEREGLLATKRLLERVRAKMVSAA